MVPLAATILASGWLEDIVGSDFLLALPSFLGGALWWVLVCVAIVSRLAMLVVVGIVWFPKDA